MRGQNHHSAWPRRIVFILALSAVVLGAMLITESTPRSMWEGFWAVDRCLDHGGRWNYDPGECDFGE